MLLFAPCREAEERTPGEDRVIQLTLPLDSGQVTGTVTSYSKLTFTLTSEAGERHRILWNAIPANKVDQYWRYLEEPESDAKGLFELGDILIRHTQGEKLAELAFNQALKLDASLNELIEQSKAGRDPDGTPRYIGTADPAMWGELSEQAMQQGVASLRGFAERTQRVLEMELKLYESDRFIVVTDLGPDAAREASLGLVQSYRAVATLLGDDPDANIFVGKCLVVLFKKRVDYIRFQDQLHKTDARGTGGLCHGFGNGHVHIAAYQRSNERQTRHILAHEMVHAYLHRYQTPQPLDDWVNEGLAEYIAHAIEPPPGSNLNLKSRLALEGKQGLGEEFYGQHLASWQYDIAGALTGYLLKRGRQVYPKFIALLKEGTPAEDALEQVYRMSPAKLTQRYKQHLDRELSKQLGG